jgi:hypothetical protein
MLKNIDWNFAMTNVLNTLHNKDWLLSLNLLSLFGRDEREGPGG